MPGGLVALLDDVAALTKLAASSLDDVAAAAGRAGTKAAGVVIDDTAVTPSYVVGLSPDRELPIIYKIAKGSLRNKLLILLPIAIALSAFAPWAITPLLMLGGAYLCFEGAEKVFEAFFGGGHHKADEVVAITDPKELEQRQVSGAIRTDFILSAEIVAITLNDLPEYGLWMRAVILAAVSIAITIGVYGVVALIVKMDDVGLHLAARQNTGAQKFGRGLVKAMTPLLKTLSVVGTAAMIWVGGQIVVHGLAEFGLAGPEHVIHGAAVAAANLLHFAHGAVEWVVGVVGNGIVGLGVGAVLVAIMHQVHKARHKTAH